LRRRRLSVCITSGYSRARLTNVDDAATASRKIQGELPGREKEAKKAGEEGYEAVRAKAQEYVRRQQYVNEWSNPY
jgi:ParB-like chromosome segregation protein Spo0J